MYLRLPRLALSALVFVAVASLLSACSGASGDSANELVVYSGRNTELVGPLLNKFAKDTGVNIKIRYGGSAELANTIMEEGKKTRADVFFSQDAGALGALSEHKMLASLPQNIIAAVPSQYHADNNQWVGTSGRVRVIVYNTDELNESQVPNTVGELTNSKWRDKIGIAPSNASFQAFVSAMTILQGKETTQAWLQGLKANKPHIYPNNLTIVEAVANGEISLGLVNNYYLKTVEQERGPVPAKNHFLSAGDPGALINVAGAGILNTTKHKPAAEKFVQYLLSPYAQKYFANETHEYPLAAGIPGPAGDPPLNQIGSPQIDLSALGAQLEPTLELLRQTGLL